MVSAENRTGLYVSIPVYFGILAASAFWAYRRMERMKETTDAISNHYLGGRAFGPFLTAGTVFASLFSGYTVVGIPNEAFRTGFLSFRWMSATAMLLLGYVTTGTRLRKASVVRNHQTPVDFITDRFQSQFLRYTIVTCQVLGSIIYLAAQVNALKGTFNSMFEVSPADANWPVITLMLIILAVEWTGGLSSVALTDSIQGLVMMTSFILLPCIIKSHFGGWSALDVTTYPRPDFFQTPTQDEQWNFWQFSMVMFGFFTLPHLMMRIYAARDLKSLRVGWAFLTISPWAAMFIGTFLGTVGVQILADAGVENPASPFTAIIEEVMNLGGFAKGVGVISFTASLAAIMSTADSLLIAVSQMITVEVVYPLWPQTNPTIVAWRGRIVSLVTTGFPLLVGIMWKDGITDLGAINFSITMQAVPAFLVGLYVPSHRGFWEPHPWSLAIAGALSQIYVFVVYFTYIKVASDPLPIDAGVTGITINLFLIIVLEAMYRILIRNKTNDETAVEMDKRKMSTTNATNKRKLLCPNRPIWDVPKLERFGETSLTPRLLNKMMTGMFEPFRNVWYTLLVVLSVSFVTPLVSENEPTLELIASVATYNGLPWWFFKQILLCIIPYAILLVTVWRTPSEFPSDEREIQKEGVDLDVIEMTPQEMNRRSMYDESNELFRRRRSTIKSQMQEMGLPVA